MNVDITWRPYIEQTKITTTATSQQSAVFGNATFAVRLGVANSASAYGVHYSVGVSPVATANSPYLPEGAVEYIRVNRGEMIALLEDTGALAVTITELTH